MVSTLPVRVLCASAVPGETVTIHAPTRSLMRRIVPRQKDTPRINGDLTYHVVVITLY